MAEHQQALAAAILADPDVVSLSLVHRRRRHQHDAEQRPIPDQPEAARPARASTRARSSGACRREPRVAGVTLYLQPVQDLTIDTNVSRTQYQFVLEDADPDRVRRMGTAARRRGSAVPSSPTSPATTQQQRPRRPTSPSTAPPPAASASRRPPSTTPCTTRSASASSRPSTPSPTSTGSSWKPTRRCSSRWPCARLASTCRRRPRRRPGAAIGHRQVIERPAPLQISHLGQFPATTCRSTWRRASRSAPRSKPSEQARGRDRPAGQLRHSFQGAALGLPGIARQRAAPGASRRCVDHLHRAGRALRELHPPAHHPLDAAVGRHRRLAGADARRRRPRHHRASSASSC